MTIFNIDSHRFDPPGMEDFPPIQQMAGAVVKDTDKIDKEALR
jgi:hypothetical protein